MTVFKPLSERYEIAENGCWLWTGARSSGGYGHFNVMGKDFQAHRYFYEFWHSTRIPPGMVLDHLCNRRRCVNPHHMQVVSQRENNLRSNSPSGINARKTECPRGHSLSGDNLYVTPNGKRRCRVCQWARSQSFGILG